LIALESLYTFIPASFLLCLAPGPDNIFVLTQSALYGRTKAFLVTLGLCTGLIVHTSAVALGIAALLQTSPVAFTALKTIGALYLLYLAWLALSASLKKWQNSDDSTPSGHRLYRRGIIMNITNPKISVFFLAFLPQFTNPDLGAVAQQVIILGGLFILVTLLVFGGIVILAGTLGGLLNRSAQIQVYLNRIAAAVYVALALNLIYETMLNKI
jgi:threonine/homoserine/homoserine lactone efflux protein